MRVALTSAVPAQLRQGVVDGVPGATVDVRIAGSSTIVYGVRYLDGQTLTNGDTVWIVVLERDLFVLGKLTPLA